MFDSRHGIQQCSFAGKTRQGLAKALNRAVQKVKGVSPNLLRHTCEFVYYNEAPSVASLVAWRFVNKLSLKTN